MDKKKRIRFASGLLATMLVFAGSVPSVLAYMTDIADPMDNKFTIALDSTCRVVEKFPEPELTDTVISYEKAVQVINTGYINEYVRVRLDFSDDDVKNKTQFSWDGKNFYSVDSYKDHLPSGWTYNSSDGYYYYTKILETGDWEGVKETLRYDAESGQYFYNDGQALMTSNMITTPLIRYVKTVFTDAKDMRTYGLYVSAESCPFYFANDYANAWKAYAN